MALSDPLKRLISELGFMGSVAAIVVGGLVFTKVPGTVGTYAGGAILATGAAGVAVSQGFLLF